MELKKLRRDWDLIEPVVKDCHTAGPERAKVLRSHLETGGFTQSSGQSICLDLLIVRA